MKHFLINLAAALFLATTIAPAVLAHTAAGRGMNPMGHLIQTNRLSKIWGPPL